MANKDDLSGFLKLLKDLLEISSKPAAPEPTIPRHKTRGSDSSLYDNICVKCGKTDVSNYEQCSEPDGGPERWAIRQKVSADTPPARHTTQARRDKAIDRVMRRPLKYRLERLERRRAVAVREETISDALDLAQHLHSIATLAGFPVVESDTSRILRDMEETYTRLAEEFKGVDFRSAIDAEVRDRADRAAMMTFPAAPRHGIFVPHSQFNFGGVMAEVREAIDKVTRIPNEILGAKTGRTDSSKPCDDLPPLDLPVYRGPVTGWTQKYANYHTKDLAFANACDVARKERDARVLERKQFAEWTERNLDDMEELRSQRDEACERALKLQSDKEDAEAALHDEKAKHANTIRVSRARKKEIRELRAEIERAFRLGARCSGPA